MSHLHLLSTAFAVFPLALQPAIAQVYSNEISQNHRPDLHGKTVAKNSISYAKEQVDESNASEIQINELVLIEGVYSSGYQHIKIVQEDESICIQGLFDFIGLYQVRDAAIEQIHQEAAAAAEQLNTRLAQEVYDQRNQIIALLEDEELLDAAIQDGQIPENVRRFKDDIQALDQFLELRASEARERTIGEIERRRIDAEQQIDEETEAILNMRFEGIFPVSSDSQNPIFYIIHGMEEFRILPQAGEGLLFGEIENLIRYVSSDISFAENADFQRCLESQRSEG